MNLDYLSGNQFKINLTMFHKNSEVNVHFDSNSMGWVTLMELMYLGQHQGGSIYNKPPL
jgi:hypothetical protein